jgi:hypothetical protein
VIQTVSDVFGARVRLTEFAANHIAAEHPDVTLSAEGLLEVVARPDCVVEGPRGEYHAVRGTRPGKWIIVVYRSIGAEGFVITAFHVRRRRAFERWRKLWP